MVLKVLGVVLQAPDTISEDKKERTLMIVPVVLIILVMVLGGIFPQFFTAPVQNLLISFQNLLN